MGPDAAVVQPENRGTAPAILLALLRVAARAPAGSVAILPSDHYVSDDRAFMAYVDAAFDAVLAHPDLVTLLGITPDGAEAEYGWIERDEWIRGQGPGALYRVRRFWEKPSPAVAETLLARGCLWNSFVMVARVPTLLALIRSALPGLYDAFAAIRPVLDTHGANESLRALYAGLPSTNFSKEVLARQAASLAVLPVGGVRWTDLGDPRRVRLVEQGTSRQLDPLVA
jgi:mannose-1-phosphate guanylyltransferase